MDTNKRKVIALTVSIEEEIDSVRVFQESQYDNYPSYNELIDSIELFNKLVERGWAKKSVPQVSASVERLHLRIRGELIHLEEEYIYSEIKLL